VCVICLYSEICHFTLNCAWHWSSPSPLAGLVERYKEGRGGDGKKEKGKMGQTGPCSEMLHMLIL